MTRFSNSSVGPLAASLLRARCPIYSISKFRLLTLFRLLGIHDAVPDMRRCLLEVLRRLIFHVARIIFPTQRMGIEILKAQVYGVYYGVWDAKKSKDYMGGVR